jgi:hypothetical protein
MKENNDLESYNKARATFNAYNQKFGRYKRDAE